MCQRMRVAQTVALPTLAQAMAMVVVAQTVAALLPRMGEDKSSDGPAYAARAWPEEEFVPVGSDDDAASGVTSDASIRDVEDAVAAGFGGGAGGMRDGYSPGSPGDEVGPDSSEPESALPELSDSSGSGTSSTDSNDDDVPPAESAERAAGLIPAGRMREVHDCIQIADLATMTLYTSPLGKVDLIVRCKNKAHGKCIFTRSLNPSGWRATKPGAGRPLGLCVAWALAGDRGDLPAKSDHMKYRPGLETRKAGREWFLALPNSADFAGKEAEQPTAGDPDEPLAVE